MKIKKNDTVRIIAGKDKGKTGKVVRAYPAEGKVVVEGVNIVTKHARAPRSGEKGQKVFFPKAVSAAKVMLVCPKCSTAARIGIRILAGDLRGKRERFCKKCSQLLTA
ncbi:50S ribosomal protein L24 [Candidatus Uhrbacteria bacterium]|nr:50S ribosomal protein L24 [Candidatus Uhrbacteria bacterium]